MIKADDNLSGNAVLIVTFPDSCLDNCFVLFHENFNNFITALHAMQTRSSDEISVRPSVRPSVRLSVCPSVCQTRAL